MKILNLNLAKNNDKRGNSSRKFSEIIINNQNSLDEEEKEKSFEFEEIHETLVDNYNRKK